MLSDAFQTARLVFRPIAPADARPIFDEWAQNPDVARCMTWRPHTQFEQTEAYVACCIKAASSRTYVLTAGGRGKVFGTFELRASGPLRLGYGYVLARSSRGQGLMTEALTAVVGWALGQPGIWRIGDICDVENLGSARLMEKAGLTCEGIARRWAVHPNLGDAPRDCFIYARAR